MVVMVMAKSGVGMACIRIFVLVHEALEQLLGRRRLIGQFHLFQHMGDNLFFINRRPDAQELVGVLTEELVDVLLLAGEAAGLGRQGARHLVVRDLDAIGFANLGQHQPESHAPLGKFAVFGLFAFFGLALVCKGLAR